MLLVNLLDRLCSEVVIEGVTAEQYYRAARRLGLHLGRSAVIADLTTETINAYLVWLKTEFDVSNTTLRNYRSSIIRIWNYASDRYDHPVCIPRRLRAPRKDAVIVRSWPLGNLVQLMKAAETLPGTLRCGIPASTFMSAWIWVGYDTGLRPGDMRELTWPDIELSAQKITICQRKTKKVHTAVFGTDSLAWLERLREYKQPLVFPLNKWGVTRWEGFLYARAEKLGFTRLRGQGIGTLRKCHATQIDAVHGIAAAAESLGHVSGITTARNHYVDAQRKTGILPAKPGA